MTPDETGYRFVPSVRHGLQPREPYTSSPPESIHGSVEVTLTVDASDPDGGSGSGEATREVRLFGPGDVKGLDHRQVVRCEPTDGTTDYPPNYFPHVEFDNPGLPWLFSPERANSDMGWKARPWLCLVAVEKGDGVSLEQDLGGPLPVLTVEEKDQFPPPSETWAWAHAQVVGEAGELDRGTVKGELSGRSDQTVSRLIAPRNLSENTAYYACVVPTFEAGRRAGLGAYPDSESEDGGGGDGADSGDGSGAGKHGKKSLGAIAWDGDGAVRLPVYYHWEFTTGPRGDFESLVRALEPRELGKDVGSRPVDLSDPGVEGLANIQLARQREDAPESASRTVEENNSGPGPLRLSGALQPVAYTEDSYLDLDLTASFRGDGRERRLSRNLRRLLNDPLVASSDDDSDGGTDDESVGASDARSDSNSEKKGADEPVVGPPLYGQWHADTERIPDGSDSGDVTTEEWLRGLNLDLLKRIPAGFGTRAIQDNQESLMAAAWDQFGDLRSGNEFIRNAQLARAVGESTRKTVPKSPPELLSITGPMHSRLRWPRSDITIHGRLSRSPMPMPVTQPAFRRIVRPRGPLSRRLDYTPDATRMTQELMTGERLRRSQPDIADSVIKPGDTVDDTVGLGHLARRNEAIESVGGDVVFEEVSVHDADDSGRTDGGRDSGPAATSEADTGRALATEALSRLDSVTEHCETAQNRLSSLETALQGEAPVGEDAAGSPEEAIKQLVFERPTVAHHSASIAESTFGPLNRSLTRLLVEAGDHAPRLTMERKDDRLSRMGSIHGDLMETVEGVIGHLRESPGEPEAAVDDVERSQTIIDRLLGVVDQLRSGIVVETTTIAYTSASVDPGARNAEMVGLSPDDVPPAEELLPVEESLVEMVSDRLGVNSDWLWGTKPEAPRKDPLEEIMAAPEFLRPMYEPLRDLSPEYLLPGIDEVPKDTVSLLATNQRFVEAYMVGCNHEMARELHWRRYPTDRRGTYFRHFWNRRGATPEGEDPQPDIGYIHTWGDEPLGQNAPGSDAEEDGNKLVLLVRGKLLQRYPNTRIYAAKAVEEGTDRVPLLEQQYEEYEAALKDTKGGEDEKDEGEGLLAESGDRLKEELGGYTWETLKQWEAKDPIFRGTLTEDVTFFGFDLTADEAVSGEGWFFVFEEEPHGPRFGLDKPSEDDYGTPPYGVSYGNSDGEEPEIRRMPKQPYDEGAEAGWDGLSWAHLVSNADDLDGKQYVEVGEDDPGGTNPWEVEDGKQWTKKEVKDEKDETTEVLPPVKKWDESDAATWGENSAHMARITWQRPVRVAVHADDMLSDHTLDEIEASGGT